MAPDTSISHSSAKPTLTSLPTDLLVRILRHLCDDNLHQHRSFLRGSNCSLFYRYFEPQLTIDGAEHVHAPFSKSLLAPALASPVLAAAINQVIELSYLTDLNTENHLPLWLHAFAPYVRAVSAGNITESSCTSLSATATTLMVRTLCRHTIQLFKTITVNHLKLNVLDLVHVPFHQFQPMHDYVLTGLCTALESTQNTLQQLALPIYCQSDICPLALEMVDLPHLKLLSVELKNAPDPTPLSRSDSKRLRLPFLRIIQAIEGHANRTLNLTTLNELRLINLHNAPCTDLTRSGCGPDFFHAVTTLRAAFNPSCTSDPTMDISFFLLFRKLKYLHWSRKPSFWDSDFEKLSRRLREVHLCNPRWIGRCQVGTKIHEPFDISDRMGVFFSIHVTYSNIVTLVVRCELREAGMEPISKYCPNLQYLSLVITPGNVKVLGSLIVECPFLTGLEIIIAEKEFGPLRKAGWQTLGKAFPRNHLSLSDVAIQMKRCVGSAVHVNIVTDCFVNVVTQIGSKAERLVFRAFTRTKSFAPVSNALRRVIDACKGSLSLTHLEVDIIPAKFNITVGDIVTASESLMSLRNSRDELLQLCEDLGKIDFGYCHRYVKEPYEV